MYITYTDDYASVRKEGHSRAEGLKFGKSGFCLQHMQCILQ